MDDRAIEILFERVYLTLLWYQNEHTEEAHIAFCTLYDLLTELDLEEDYINWREADE